MSKFAENFRKNQVGYTLGFLFFIAVVCFITSLLFMGHYRDLGKEGLTSLAIATSYGWKTFIAAVITGVLLAMNASD